MGDVAAETEGISVRGPRGKVTTQPHWSNAIMLRIHSDGGVARFLRSG